VRAARATNLLLLLLAGCATTPAPSPVALEPSIVVLTAPPADWSALDGQTVRIEAPLAVLDSFPLATKGELQVAFGGRVPIPTEVAEPGAAAAAVAADSKHRRFVLDDGRDEPPADPANPLPGVPSAASLRFGSTLTGVEGIVHVDDHGVRVVPARVARIDAAPRPAAPTVPGALRLASFNVLNLFNGDGHGGGFPTLRGARTPDELARQQGKLVASVQALAPDAAALMEIENDGYGPDSALAQFVAALNAAGPVRDYAFVDAGTGPGTNPIRVAIVYRTGKLRPRGKPAKLDHGPFAERSRVPLAQAFTIVGAPRKAPALVLVAVHLKSKGCGRGAEAASGSDVDTGDGQACFNTVRVDSARRIVEWMRGDPTRSHSDRTVLLGDFNSYAREEPLDVLREAGWIDAFERFPEAGMSYSFVFGGEAGRLDHAWLSPGAAAQLRGAAHWHNNADEPASSDYHAGTDLSAYGASDHDPLVVGMDWSEAKPLGQVYRGRYRYNFEVALFTPSGSSESWCVGGAGMKKAELPNTTRGSADVVVRGQLGTKGRYCNLGGYEYKLNVFEVIGAKNLRPEW
jgi:predicted extracellular nuclease